MFERPEDDELYDQIAGKQREYRMDARGREIAVVGGGVAALTAGVFLEENHTPTVLLVESEHLGGRLTWGNGPVPVFDPALNLLEELEYPLESNPPVWVDRNHFLSFLVERYIDAGGRILRGIYLEEPPRPSDGGIRLSLTLDEATETLDFDDLVLTLPRFGSETLEEGNGDALEVEVKETRRRSDGTVQAGRLVLPDAYAETGLPLESADLLSGRKAAEIVLNDRE